jgi:hypothetical protein
MSAGDGPLGQTYEPQFTYEGRYASGRHERGVVAIGSAKLAVAYLMRRRLSTCAVFHGTDEDGLPIQVGGIHQQRKGARRRAWWHE